MKQRIDRSSGLGSQEPRVGIFWLLDGRSLLLDSTPLSEAEPYGDCLTHPGSHIERWEDFQQQAMVPREIEYEEWPRGRTVFDAKKGKFILYADNCILRRKALVRKIIKRMNLPENGVQTESDTHYRCSRCLRR